MATGFGRAIMLPLGAIVLVLMTAQDSCGGETGTNDGGEREPG
jgi:hypothetical protein